MPNTHVLPGQAICLSGWFHHILDLFSSCVSSRFHMRGRQSSFTWGPRGSTHRERRDAGWAVESFLPFSSHTQCPWLLQILRVPGSASKPTELRGGVPHAASKFHKNFEFLKALPIFFQPIPDSYLNLTFSGCSSCILSGTLGDRRNWSFRVQQDVFFICCGKETFHLSGSIQTEILQRIIPRPSRTPCACFLNKPAQKQTEGASSMFSSALWIL